MSKSFCTMASALFMSALIGCGGDNPVQPPPVNPVKPSDPTLSITARPTSEVLNQNTVIRLATTNCKSVTVVRTPSNISGDPNTVPVTINSFGCDSIVVNPGSTMAPNYSPSTLPMVQYTVTANGDPKAANSVTAPATFTVPLYAGPGVGCSDISLSTDTVWLNDVTSVTVYSKAGIFTSRNADKSYKGSMAWSLGTKGDTLLASVIYVSPHAVSYSYGSSGSSAHDLHDGILVPGPGGIACPYTIHVVPKP